MKIMNTHNILYMCLDSLVKVLTKLYLKNFVGLYENPTIISYIDAIINCPLSCTTYYMPTSATIL